MSFQAQSAVKADLALPAEIERFILNLFDKSKGFVFFIRHGQTDWNLLRKMQGRDGIPLNETGIMQARDAAEGIHKALLETGFKFDLVITSPLSRANLTGQIIADKIGCECVCDERVIERDFGILSGCEYSPQSKAITEDVSIEGLEPLSEVLDRVSSFIKDRVKLGKRILVVSHGSVTKIFALQAEKSPRVTNLNELLKNCHMLVYSYDGNKIRMEGYNISPHGLGEFIASNDK